MTGVAKYGSTDKRKLGAREIQRAIKLRLTSLPLSLVAHLRLKAMNSVFQFIN